METDHVSYAAQSDAQMCLSENLILLNECGSRPLYLAPCYNKCYTLDNVKTRKNTKADLRMLDIISTCLTTGETGDSVAALFIKKEAVSLLLARSGGCSSSERDTAVTHQFISALKTANHWMDLFPFLISHSKLKLNKQIRKVRESISYLLDYAGFRKAMEYMELSRSEKDDFIVLLHSCSDGTSFTMEENAIAISSNHYKKLYDQAKTLLQSPIMQDLCEELWLRNSVGLLQRRLEKICQYSDLELLIKLIKRVPGIPFQWIAYSGDSLGNTVTRSAGPEELLGRRLGFTLTPEDKEFVAEQYPRLFENWSRGHMSRPRIHPEILILLYYTENMLEDDKEPEANTVPLGCSNGPCICCAQFIILLNDHKKISWRTSGCTGKIYCDWALPGAADVERIIGWDAMRSLMLKSVTEKLSFPLFYLRKFLRTDKACNGKVATTTL